MPADSHTILPKSLVRRRATTGGMTMAEAMRVTPSTWSDTTMAPASISENIVSTHPVGTP